MAKLKVELEHTDWQMVLNMLATAPYRDVAPIIGKMAPQLQVPLPPGNGADVVSDRAPNG